MSNEKVYGSGHKSSNSTQLAANHRLKEADRAQREEIEKWIKKKERKVGKNQTIEEGKTVLIQDLKAKKWDTKGTIEKVTGIKIGDWD